MGDTYSVTLGAWQAGSTTLSGHTLQTGGALVPGGTGSTSITLGKRERKRVLARTQRFLGTAYSSLASAPASAKGGEAKPTPHLYTCTPRATHHPDSPHLAWWSRDLAPTLAPSLPGAPLAPRGPWGPGGPWTPRSPGKPLSPWRGEAGEGPRPSGGAVGTGGVPKAGRGVSGVQLTLAPAGPGAPASPGTPCAGGRGCRVRAGRGDPGDRYDPRGGEGGGPTVPGGG